MKPNELGAITLTQTLIETLILTLKKASKIARTNISLSRFTLFNFKFMGEIVSSKISTLHRLHLDC